MQSAVATVAIWVSNLFDEFEDVFQSAFERLFVDGVITSWQMANDCEWMRICNLRDDYQYVPSGKLL